ncbi:MAG: type II secretion system protein GspM [Giesbergeria sp.]
MSTPQTSTPAWQAQWQSLAPRERSLVLSATLLVAAALMWWVALAPALRTLREAPARHAELDAQLERVQALAAEAQQLQADASTRPSQAEAQRALQTATTSLGSSVRTTMVGDRATVRLQGLPATTLAPWLAQVRGNARSVPVEAHLTRSTAAQPTSGAAPTEPRWEGSIVLSLPAR